jgi:L-fuconolactonase
MKGSHRMKEGTGPARIDAHQHFWRYDPAVQTFIDESMSVLKRDFLPEHSRAELARAGLAGCIAVQAPQTLEETRWLLELSDANDFIRAVVGWVDLRSKSLDAVLDELTEHPRLRGIRHILQDEPNDIFEDASFKRGVARLAHHGLTYDMLVFERQLPLAGRLMASLPEVSFVLDHVGKPNLREPNLEFFLRDLRPIAKLPNVVCKLSGLVTEADWQGWKPETLRPFVEGAVELFGTERLLFGSDWPVCLLAGSYRDVFGLIDDYFREYSEAERAALFGGNALRAYRIPG